MDLIINKNFKNFRLKNNLIKRKNRADKTIIKIKKIAHFRYNETSAIFI